MAIILKAEEKFRTVAGLMQTGFTDDDFIEKFIQMYPKDWKKISDRYQEHERKTKPGKSHPMPEPRKYIKNVSHQFRQQARNAHQSDSQ